MVDENPDLEFESREVNDVQICQVIDSSQWSEFPEVCFAQMGSRLLISNDFKKLESHIMNAGNNKPEETMFSQPEIEKLFEFGKSIGCEGPISVVRFDTEKLVNRYWNMMVIFMPTPVEGEEGFQIPKLPAADTIANGLTPLVWASFRTENGYQLYQRSVTPMPAAAFLLPIFWGFG